MKPLREKSVTRYINRLAPQMSIISRCIITLGAAKEMIYIEEFFSHLSSSPVSSFIFLALNQLFPFELVLFSFA